MVTSDTEHKFCGTEGLYMYIRFFDAVCNDYGQIYGIIFHGQQGVGGTTLHKFQIDIGIFFPKSGKQLWKQKCADHWWYAYFYLLFSAPQLFHHACGRIG